MATLNNLGPTDPKDNNSKLDGFHIEIDVNAQSLKVGDEEVIKGEPLKADTLASLPPAYGVGEFSSPLSLREQLIEALNKNPYETPNQIEPRFLASKEEVFKEKELKNEHLGSEIKAQTNDELSQGASFDSQVLKENSKISGSDEEPSKKYISEDNLSQEELEKFAKSPVLTANGDDPDKVPVVPTLRDDEVPNMPGAILCHAREMLGLSQRDVAARLKLRVNTISDLEHDRLNQPTAAPFIRKHLESYAKLVNIDPRAVLNLYNQNVRELSARLTFGAPKKASRGTKLKWFIYGVIFLAIALGLALNTIWDESDEQSFENEPLVIEDQNLNQEPQNLDQNFEVEGTLDNGTSQSETSNEQASSTQGEVVLKPTVSEINDAKAKAQAEALSNLNKPQEDNTPISTQPLKVEGVLPVNSNPEQLQVKPQDKVPLQAQDATTKEQALNEHKSQSTPEAKANQKESEAVASNAQANPEQNSTSQEQDKAQKSEEVEVDPVLTSNLLDLSSRVSLQGREGLASMNQALIKVKRKVALTVTDSRSKVLAKGVYDAGNTIKVTGIPPLKVATSDTQAIEVSYMGGRVVTPNAKQASFNLPSKGK